MDCAAAWTIYLKLQVQGGNRPHIPPKHHAQPRHLKRSLKGMMSGKIRLHRNMTPDMKPKKKTPTEREEPPTP